MDSILCEKGWSVFSSSGDTALGLQLPSAVGKNWEHFCIIIYWFNVFRKNLSMKFNAFGEIIEISTFSKNS